MANKRRFQPIVNTVGDSSRRLFVGSLDDSVLRYPWKGYTFDIDRFNKMLIFYALLGPPLCCRIGNIIYDYRLFNLLRFDSLSPLRHLARAGFFQFQMLEHSINQTIERRLSFGTNSTIKFVDEYQWRAGSAIHHELDAIDRDLEHGAGKLVYKPEFRTAFKKIMEMKISSNLNFLKVYDEWTKRFDSSNQTRSNFEILCESVLDNYEDRRQAMAVINSANHYAYGVGMTAFGIEALVETKELQRLRDITAPVMMNSGKRIEPARVDELLKLKVPQIIGRYLKIPEVLFYSVEHWRVLSSMLAPNGVNYDEFSLHKQDLINKINDLSTEPDVPRARKELQNSCRRYSRFLQSKLNISGSKEAKYKFVMAIENMSFKMADQLIDEMPENIVKSIPVVAGVATEAAVPPLLLRGIRIVLSLCAEKGFDLVRRKIDDAVLGFREENIKFTEEISEAVDTLSIKTIVPIGFASQA